MNDIAFLPTPVQLPGANIKVVGVGGAGCNALNRMIESGVSGVQLIAMNTDRQSLDQSKAEVRIHLSPSLMRGLGAGSNPQRGAEAAEQSRDEILESLQGADMVFITAGMGGGTGTGASPVIASCASELGILAIAVVLTPFSWEGLGKGKRATKGLEDLRNVADTVIVVSNEKLKHYCPPNANVAEAYKAADSVLIQGVRGISDLILRPGIVNVDFADVEAVLRNSRRALIGTGEGMGDDAILEAIKKALDCPLLEGEHHGPASTVIVSVMANWQHVAHSAIEKAMMHLSDHYKGQPDIKLGQIDAPELDCRVIATILASGFDNAFCEAQPADALYKMPPFESMAETVPIGSTTCIYGEGHKTVSGEFSNPTSTPTRLTPHPPTPSGEIDGHSQDLSVPAIIRIPPGRLPIE